MTLFCLWCWCKREIMLLFVVYQVGPKKAREMWFLARFYTASEAEKMGLVNVVVPVSS